MSLLETGETSADNKQASRLWKLVAWAALGHVVVILALSPSLYWSSDDSPEAIFERGEQAMQEGKYVEAMELYRRVMDQQPKPPPIYAKAAENHRMADRLARQSAGKAMEQSERRQIEAGKSAEPTSRPSSRPAEPPRPTGPYIPPELRGG